MTRVTIGLTVLGLVVLSVAYVTGVNIIHGGGVLSHMYWATGAMLLVVLADFIAVAHLVRAERMLQQLRALCEKNGISFEGLE